MNKGVSVEQVARVTKAFTDAGILVHAYLMYGFPTQTRAGHRGRARIRAPAVRGRLHPERLLPPLRACTVHSPVGLNPEEYGVQLIPLPPVTFAKNDVGFLDPVGTDHDAMGVALNKALYNYMHGIGLDEDVRSWFPFKVPKTTVDAHDLDAQKHSRSGLPAAQGLC
jgi:hypothetical protein